MKENYRKIWKRKAFKIVCDLDALSRASPDSEKGEIEYLIDLSPIYHCENNGYFQKEPWDISSTARLMVDMIERSCTLSLRCYSGKNITSTWNVCIWYFPPWKKLKATTLNKTSANKASLNMGWVENCAKLEGAKKLKWGVFVLSARGNF